MRSLAKTTAVLLTVLVVGQQQPCSARGIAGPDNFHVDPTLVRMRLALQPWYQDLVDSIRTQPKFEPLMQKMFNRSITCTFVMKPTGELSKPTVAKSSGLKTLDQAFLDLVLKMAPLKAAPNYLPFQEGAKLDVYFARMSNAPYVQVYVVEPKEHFAPPYTFGTRIIHKRIGEEPSPSPSR